MSDNKKDVSESAVELSMSDGVSIGDEAELSGRMEDQRPRTSGLFKTVMNVVNTIIGSGILSLPIAVSEIGWILGIVLLAFGALSTLFGVHLLNKVAHRLGGTELGFGVASVRTYPWLMIVVDITVALTTFGITVAYLGIAADILPACVEQLAPSVDAGSILRNSYFWLILCWGVLAAPLSMLRSVGFLGYTSAIAVACMLYTTVIVALFFFGVFDPCASVPAGEPCKGDITPANFNFIAIFKSLPVFLLAYCCSPTLFNLYNDIRDPSVKRMDLSAVGGMVIATTLYGFVALGGYLTYGDLVKSNVLNSYPISAPVTVARIGTAFVVIVSYPLLMHPSRDATVHSLKVILGLLSPSLKESFADANSKPSLIFFYTVAAVLNLASFALALLRVDLNLLLSLTGALGVTNLTFSVPAIFFWKLFEDVTPHTHNPKNLLVSDYVKRMLCIPMVLFGLFVTCASLYANFS